MKAVPRIHRGKEVFLSTSKGNHPFNYTKVTDSSLNQQALCMRTNFYYLPKAVFTLNWDNLSLGKTVDKGRIFG